MGRMDKIGIRRAALVYVFIRFESVPRRRRECSVEGLSCMDSDVSQLAESARPAEGAATCRLCEERGAQPKQLSCEWECVRGWVSLSPSCPTRSWVRVQLRSWFHGLGRHEFESHLLRNTISDYSMRPLAAWQEAQTTSTMADRHSPRQHRMVVGLQRCRQARSLLHLWSHPGHISGAAWAGSSLRIAARQRVSSCPSHAHTLGASSSALDGLY